MNINTEWNEEPTENLDQAELDRLAEEERKRLDILQRRQANAVRQQQTRRQPSRRPSRALPGVGFASTGPGGQASALNNMIRQVNSGFATENNRRVKVAQAERERQHEIDLLLLRLAAERQE
jgi:hypothetical protein